MRYFLLITLFFTFLFSGAFAQVKVNVQNGHTEPVSDICFGGPNEGYLFTGSKDGSIKIWDSKEGVLINTLTGKTAEIQGLMVNSRSFLISADKSGRIIWWDYERQKDVFTEEAEITDAKLIRGSGNKKYLIFYCNEETLCRSDNNFEIFNTLSGRWVKLKDSLTLHGIVACGSMLAGIEEGNEQVFVIDFLNNKKPVKRILTQPDVKPKQMAFMNDGGLITVLYPDNILRSFYTTRLPLTPGTNRYRDMELKIPVDTNTGISSNNKQHLAFWYKRNTHFINPETPETTDFTVVSDTTVVDVSFPDSLFALIQLVNGFSLVDLKSKRIMQFPGYKTPLACYAYSQSKKMFAFAEKQSNTAHVIDVSSGHYTYSLTSPLWPTFSLRMKDSTHLLLIQDGKLCRALDTHTGRISEADTCTVLTDESEMTDNIQPDAEGLLFDIFKAYVTIDSVHHSKRTQWKKVHEVLLKDYSGVAKSVVVSPDTGRVFLLDGEGRIIAFKKSNGTKKFYDLVYEKEFISIPFRNDNWAILFPDNLYTCSKESLRWLSMRNGNEDYSIEELDLFYNRPDVVLKRLGCEDSTLIEIYRKAFEKRLKRNGFDTTILGKSLYRPWIDIIGQEGIPPSTDNDFVTIDIEIQSHSTPLKSLQVYVNEVPVYGSAGIPLNELKSKKCKKRLSIPLTNGSNEIKLQALDENNIHGMYSKLTIYSNKPVKERNLYVVVVSVSQYAQPAMNLKYARKDGHDFALLMRENKRYTKVIIDTLFDADATRSKIEAVKNTLALSRPEDDVVLYFSGHGVLDTAYNFYFATHDIDFSHPENSALPYERIEWLLDSIPAHNKLLLLDACHSGEVDRDEMATSEKQVIKTDAKDVKKYKGSELINQESVHIGMQNTFELMNEMFSGLSSTNGAIVISAAAGNSFAFESDEWKNGVFTYCLLRGLRSGDADLNHDGEITVLELKKYTGKQVETLTHGKQKPTSRMENSRFDWVIF